MIWKLFVPEDYPQLHQEICSLSFRNPIGLAAGFDKNCVALEALALLSFGFIECGTIVREMQDGNPRQRIFLLPLEYTLINRMGFSSGGVLKVRNNLMHRAPLSIPLGISIGKLKNTPIEQAIDEYLELFSGLCPYADYFAINVSSPNTPGLRSLQDKQYLGDLIRELVSLRVSIMLSHAIRKDVPIFVKISLDLTCEAIDDAIDVMARYGASGMIATNTSADRALICSSSREAGGVSGMPLQRRACEVVSHIRKRASHLPTIGVGSIFSGEDTYRMFANGASLVQVYTSFVYKVPSIIKRITGDPVRIIEKRGVANIKEIWGAA